MAASGGRRSPRSRRAARSPGGRNARQTAAIRVSGRRRLGAGARRPRADVQLRRGQLPGRRHGSSSDTRMSAVAGTMRRQVLPQGGPTAAASPRGQSGYTGDQTPVARGSSSTMTAASRTIGICTSAASTCPARAIAPIHLPVSARPTGLMTPSSFSRPRSPVGTPPPRPGIATNARRVSSSRP